MSDEIYLEAVKAAMDSIREDLRRSRAEARWARRARITIAGVVGALGPDTEYGAKLQALLDYAPREIPDMEPPL